MESQLGPNVRVVTALDLVDVFGEMSAVEDLQKFLIGRGEIRYDTPKFIESIVCLRMIGSRVPVLRLDRDVLIPPEGVPFDSAALMYAITQICEGVVEHHDNTQVLATILSANYKTPDNNSEDVMAWNRGYATRILPSLLVPTNPNDVTRYINPGGVSDWEPELRSHFRLKLTQHFYEDIWQWGAPTTAVISGALLYMNDAVVLNVPPFSNFSQMVMWIDDHLRYVLHREMGDFCRQTQIGFKTNEPLHVQYSDVQVSKYRPAEGFLLYTVQIYLPSLLWGSFFDYWLCPSPLLKRRGRDVPAADIDRWRQERQDGRPGILATAVREARAGCLPDEGLLRERLKKAADERLKVLLSVWGNLRNNKSHSFASAWVHDKFPKPVKDAMLNAKLKIAPKLPQSVEDFRDGLKDSFNELLDDTCRYVKWVFEWPHVVSVIRSVPPGEFRSDLEWKPLR
ncbi:hypothetical protein HYR99_35205 [Candidatus Poribacteria bacterium]|nr:hypothetical protein [Candidatus Poribacteria bacterium]